MQNVGFGGFTGLSFARWKPCGPKVGRKCFGVLVGILSREKLEESLWPENSTVSLRMG